jgi:hypothetical protein
VTKTVRALGAAVAMAAVAMGVAACGGKGDGTDGTATGGNNGNGFQAYISCLSEHGVTLPQQPGNRPTDQPRPNPSRSPGGQGGNGQGGTGQGGTGQGGGFPGGGGLFGEQAPQGVDQTTWDAARTACESVRPTAGPGGQGGPGGFDNSAFTAYRNCLSDHGVTMSQGPGDLTTADPKVAAAVKACEALRPTGAPRPQPTQSN